MTESISIPSPGSPWYPDVVTFALSYNAYDRDGGFDPVATSANALQDAWRGGEPLPDDLDVLRVALFFEERRWRHFDEEPAGEDRRYIDALLESIRRLAGDTLAGPPDPLP